MTTLLRSASTLVPSSPSGRAMNGVATGSGNAMAADGLEQAPDQSEGVAATADRERQRVGISRYQRTINNATEAAHRSQLQPAGSRGQAGRLCAGHTPSLRSVAKRPTSTRVSPR